MNTRAPILKIHPKDNVAVALDNLNKGYQVHLEGSSFQLVEAIPLKHKFSTKDFKPHDSIYMYGVLVGEAVKPISQGSLLTTENIKHKIQDVQGKTAPWEWTPPSTAKWKARTFNGYHRPDGQVGTDNIWLFFPLVFCENRNIETLKAIFEKEINPPEKEPLQALLSQLVRGEEPKSEPESISRENSNQYNNIKVRFLTHQGGCGGTRQDAQSLARMLAGYVNNPNVAGATVLSLGCQNLEIDIFKEALSKLQVGNKKPVLIYDQQTEGTVNAFLSKIIKNSFEEIKKANLIERSPAPLTKLTIGLECGGSDGFSGITANPTLGHVSDILSDLGGKSILAEFPELAGVEQELVNRCATELLASKFLDLMKQYEKAAAKVGSGFDMNPSPGNIKDGLITDAMKSAGAAKKSGNAPITDVLDYTEYAQKAGVSLLCTPGNDVESTTALAGSGANIILFTTGLGTPTGNPITPVVKISTNSILTQKMSDIIDFDCGTIITERRSLEEVGDALLEYIINVASGIEIPKAVQLRQNDFIPWKRGVSL
ncbi:MAG: altronate dehydratase family protein [Flavobacteriaceae bacterium]|jgi:altronate hydrolase|nr:altronate dehydratase family protein [Flavobacteriaceae bacterium]